MLQLLANIWAVADGGPHKGPVLLVRAYRRAILRSHGEPRVGIFTFDATVRISRTQNTHETESPITSLPFFFTFFPRPRFPTLGRPHRGKKTTFIKEGGKKKKRY